MLVEKDLSYKIWGAALAVHKALGPGLLESTVFFVSFVVKKKGCLS